LSFDRTTMGSDVLAKAGYGRGMYALYPPSEQSIGWEAMQRTDKGDEQAIWRGELTGAKIEGTLMKYVKKGQGDPAMQQFSFTGTRMADAPPEPAPEAAEAPATPEPSAPQATAPVSDQVAPLDQPSEPAMVEPTAPPAPVTEAAPAPEPEAKPAPKKKRGWF
jgi:hypothetical protein